MHESKRFFISCPNNNGIATNYLVHFKEQSIRDQVFNAIAQVRDEKSKPVNVLKFVEDVDAVEDEKECYNYLQSSEFISDDTDITDDKLVFQCYSSKLLVSDVRICAGRMWSIEVYYDSRFLFVGRSKSERYCIELPDAIVYETLEQVIKVVGTKFYTKIEEFPLNDDEKVERLLSELGLTEDNSEMYASCNELAEDDVKSKEVYYDCI
ncbi:hypothetical protein ROZALSC1DRAFT_30645 [Rozella allomycis CSF55]|uniref:Uncharacterized protein n=1 Tax=Rozella allomycis (strain CSF55) TaxID=988480 RepID=A0A075B099_ROZAC|nr:hypothetical protein O9G_001827 [Rozella allomycis CSF55]RKP17565.1 hypothetical protein ROZALSC1DRAFT_30645 [Rozella allomycis CSF55]|eukprot:EPZ34214.1 hypothetical protein O9G_001827 [Rozella allomycis CSF55]